MNIAEQAEVHIEALHELGYSVKLWPLEGTDPDLLCGYEGYSDADNDDLDQHAGR
ncbi:hypothetical protein [Candidatus Solirubrobacter pratensis]|uniref:hypothetical protein n=1 Tax=Candidatus Solirubrobacter pratensis TaxID=1298857 RepID=UPI00040B7445|nr:hypothetical protein [Candidatus Solirubrobacter pratensis]